jgi:multidrug efflux pump subunit AcrB
MEREIKRLRSETNLGSTHQRNKKSARCASVSIIGGRSRQVSVTLDKDKMAQNHVDFLSMQNRSREVIRSCRQGTWSVDTAFFIETGNFLTSRDEVEQLIVGTNEGQPVYLKQVAIVEDGPEKASQYVFYGNGHENELATKFHSDYPAVTLSIAKKKGADAMSLSQRILTKVEHLKKDLVPSEVQITVTRNYGQTASEKVSELLLHLLVAIIAVTCFVMLAMGWRGGLVVFLSVPVTFALTLFSYYLLDYTLNRITLFALVFIRNCGRRFYCNCGKYAPVF